MELKEITEQLKIKGVELYKLGNTNQQKLSYQKKNNLQNYNNILTAAIVNHFNINHNELIKILELNKIQKESNK